VQLLIDQIEDERRMFAGAALTRAEREQQAFNERILAIATEIKRSHEATQEETYVMPQTYEKDSKGLTERQKLLKARYKCASLTALRAACSLLLRACSRVPVGSAQLRLLQPAAPVSLPFALLAACALRVRKAQSTPHSVP
jgi:hypothetical protein